MIRGIYIGLCVIITLLGNTISVKAQHTIRDGIILKLSKQATKEWNVQLKGTHIGVSDIDRITDAFQAEQVSRLYSGKTNESYIYLINFSSNIHFEKIIAAYRQSEWVEYAEPDALVAAHGAMATTPNDAYYSRQYALKNDGNFVFPPSKQGADIDMEKAWDVEQGDTNVIMGIIDTGVRLTHPELSGRLWTNKREIPNNYIDDDSNGFVDDFRGWDFINKDNNPTDDHGHGTSVTSVAAANGNNGIGYAGVDWNCKIMVLKGLNTGGIGSYAFLAEAVYYGVDHRARVLNMSLGGTYNSKSLKDAVDYATAHGTLIVASMGNSGILEVQYPAGYAGVMAVGSTNADDKRTDPFFWSISSGSNYGKHISVVAPGNYIYCLSNKSDTDYNTYYGGTSQAAPLVSGLATLLLAQDTGRSIATIRYLIEHSAEDQVGTAKEDTKGWDQFYGHGRINAYQALTACLPSKSSTAITTCKSYQWNHLLLTNSGTYIDTIMNATGCDSVMTLLLIINKADASISQLPGGLSSNVSNALYQWLNCDSNYSAVVGATSQVFHPSHRGNYALAIEHNYCVDTSQCIFVSMLDIQNLAHEQKGILYPNPFAEQTYMRFNNPLSHASIYLYHACGLLIKTIDNFSGNELLINRDGLDSGVYFLKIYDRGKMIQEQKLVILDAH